jgi:exopolysaccharide biosynthesis WecB/TagA/CpsF family protein
MINFGRFNILGVRISAVDYAAAVERIAQAAKSRAPLAVSALAVHGLMTGAMDPVHRFRLNEFDLLVPDGQPVRWALRWLHGVALPDRVYGPLLMLKTCDRAAADGLPVFLYGSTMETLAALQQNLTTQFPNLRIAGMRASRFRQLTPVERDETVAEIRGSGAAITFVGLGCPRQEVWVYEFRRALSMPLLAVGAAFAFHAGMLPQAPAFLQRRGLEWAYRLAQEPRRLWKRYLFLNPLYLTLLLVQRLRLRRFDPTNCRAPVGELLYG